MLYTQKFVFRKIALPYDAVSYSSMEFTDMRGSALEKCRALPTSFLTRVPSYLKERNWQKKNADCYKARLIQFTGLHVYTLTMIHRCIYIETSIIYCK